MSVPGDRFQRARQHRRAPPPIAVSHTEGPSSSGHPKNGSPFRVTTGGPAKNLALLNDTRPAENSAMPHLTAGERRVVERHLTAGELRRVERPLRHVAGFPDLGLLRVLRPTPAASADDGPSHRTAGSCPGSGPPGWFPRSPRPPDRRHQPAQEFPATTCHGCALLPSPDPPDSSWWTSLDGLSAAGSSRIPLRLACRTRTIWQCWSVPALSGLLTALTPVPGIRLPSASTGPLRRAGGGVLPSPHGQKAPRGARCPMSRLC